MKVRNGDMPAMAIHNDGWPSLFSAVVDQEGLCTGLTKGAAKMNLTTEQIEQILDGAPEGATHVEHTGLNSTAYLFMPRGDGSHKIWVNERWFSSDSRRIEQCWPIHALSDLREILTLRQRVEELEFKKDSQAITMLYALGGYLTAMKTPITFSENHSASPIVDIISSIVESNNLSGECDWDNYKPPKGEQDDE